MDKFIGELNNLENSLYHKFSFFYDTGDDRINHLGRIFAHLHHARRLLRELEDINEQRSKRTKGVRKARCRKPRKATA